MSRAARVWIALAIAIVVLPGMALYAWSAPRTGDSLVGQCVVTDFGDAARPVSRRVGDCARAELNPPRGRVVEEVESVGRVLSAPRPVFVTSFVPGRDGVRVLFEGREIVFGVEELRAREAYDKAFDLESISIELGLDDELVFALASEALGESAQRIRDRGRFERVRLRRRLPHAAKNERVYADSVTDADLEAGARAAAQFLVSAGARGEKFRYLMRAFDDRDLPEPYSWARHAGAAFYLARASNELEDTVMRRAAENAVSQMKQIVLNRCGDAACLSVGPFADVGTTSLGALAIMELDARGHDPELRSIALSLVDFLRAQQRADGELMHRYNRAIGKPEDVQLPYFSGEAALALARSAALYRRPEDRDAARALLRHLTEVRWRFVGHRYYFDAEHWTCQAVAELDALEPVPRSLDFCIDLAWWTYGLQLRAGETAWDAEGLFGTTPFVLPRITPTAARIEGIVATLAAARRRGRHPREIAMLESQVRAATAALARYQFLPGPVHAFAAPEHVRGAMPGSVVDYRLRIDYAQHAGAAMLAAWRLRVASSHDRARAPK